MTQASVGDNAPATELSQLSALVDQVERVFHGKREVVRLAVAALLARGHVLFEDVPGVGKTTLAQALARAMGLGFRRIQFTSDLLPSDVLGVSVYDPRNASFEVRPGPIFTNVALCDEINRAPPRTQSGLLQAMEEGKVNIDQHTLELPRPFMVMATQNPLEHHGTYPLPESQLDRFLVRLTIGYPGREAEKQILLEAADSTPLLDRLEPVLDPAQLLALQEEVDGVQADDSLVEYLMEVVRRTRNEPGFSMGVSPRGAIALFRVARAYALVEGRRYLVPDDIRNLVVPCLAHRLLPVGSTSATAEAHEEAAVLLEEMLEQIPVPV
jgi:MoxR-like ATPase